ncbi:MAG: ribosome silencing factor [Candidatus Dadabacteria bacterium]|nr:MAG: ribosome silencing factor [Candidatus Dadabacteria bacterium]
MDDPSSSPDTSPLPYLRTDTADLLRTIVHALDDRKAEDIQVVVVGEVSSVCDVFVLCSGTSQRHANTLVDHVVDACREQGIRPYGSEGQGTGWALVDYGDIVVHVFDRETREYYELERLWLDAPRIPLAELDLPLAS